MYIVMLLDSRCHRQEAPSAILLPLQSLPKTPLDDTDDTHHLNVLHIHIHIPKYNMEYGYKKIWMRKIG